MKVEYLIETGSEERRDEIATILSRSQFCKVTDRWRDGVLSVLCHDEECAEMVREICQQEDVKYKLRFAGDTP